MKIIDTQNREQKKEEEKETKKEKKKISCLRQ
jgi:hypothetical protein